MSSILVLTLLVLSSMAYYLGRRRAFSVAQGAIRKLHSLPVYYGLYTAIWCGLPALLIVAIWLAFESSLISQLVVAGLPDELRNMDTDRLNLVVNDIKKLVSGNIVSRQADANVQAAAERYQNMINISHAAMAVVALSIAIAGGALTLTRIKAEQRARNVVEAIITGLLILCASIAILTTIGIVLSVLFESIVFFRSVPVSEFLFGLEWSPQTAIRSDQVGSSGAFGAVPLFTGTLLISFIAMTVTARSCRLLCAWTSLSTPSCSPPRVIEAQNNWPAPTMVDWSNRHYAKCFRKSANGATNARSMR